MEGRLMFYVTPRLKGGLSEDMLRNELRKDRLESGAEYLCIDALRDAYGQLMLLIVLKDGELRVLSADKLRAVMPFRVYEPSYTLPLGEKEYREPVADGRSEIPPKKGTKKAAAEGDDLLDS